VKIILSEPELEKIIRKEVAGNSPKESLVLAYKKNSLTVPDGCVEESFLDNGSVQSKDGKSVATENGIVRKFLKSFSVEEESWNRQCGLREGSGGE
jgi:hypothetical protein